MFDKKEYWKRRKEGKSGTETIKDIIVSTKPSDATVSFTNDGQMVVKNRAYKRRAVNFPSNEQQFKVPRKLASYKKNQEKRKRVVARKQRLALKEVANG